SNWLNPNNYNLTNFHGDDYTTYLSINNVNNGNDIRTQTYPNPAKDILNLSFDNNNEDIRLEIYNQLGVKLIRETIKANQNHKSINIEKLESGVYFIRYISPSSSWSDKIIIEK
ncbi:MAG: T9SS type A sorting domain-containing protein, partial [Bacteroidales bacterium]